VDEQERAPIADSPAQWASDMDSFDLPGIDLPSGGFSGSTPTPGAGKTGSQNGSGENAPQVSGFTDDRDQQASLDIGPTPTEARESRTATEQSEGGLFEDTRESVNRGPQTNDPDGSEQESLPFMSDPRKDGQESGPDMSDFMP